MPAEEEIVELPLERQEVGIAYNVCTRRENWAPHMELLWYFQKGTELKNQDTFCPVGPALSLATSGGQAHT